MSKCTRCGKERIIVSTYQEKVEKSMVTYTITICPDPECQKMVDQNLKKEKLKRDIIQDEQEKRALQRAQLKKSSS